MARFIRDHGNWKVSSSIWGHAAQTSLRKERHGLESDEPKRIFLMMSKIQKAVAEQYMKIQWRLIQLFIVTKKKEKRKEKKVASRVWNCKSKLVCFWVSNSLVEAIVNRHPARPHQVFDIFLDNFRG